MLASRRAERRHPTLALLPVWFAACLGAIGCDESNAGDSSDAGTDADAADAAQVPLREVLLIDHSAWNNYPVEQDPLPEHQPAAPIDCGITGWFVEREAVEVDTNQCNYLLIEHPALVDVPKGSEIELEFWYFDLVAPEPAVAHAALFFDADLQWETHVDIPGLANLQRLRFRTTRALRAGEPIRLHLHNHGQNFWNVGEVFAYVP
jgi:hypothetical protein